MRTLLLAGLATLSLLGGPLTPGEATAQNFFNARPLDPAKVDSKDLIRHDPPSATPVYTPEAKKDFSNSDLQRRLDTLATQEQQIRAERQAIMDEAARRAK
jgi:hypothetical protein